MATSSDNVIILGGGIIGLSIAYYISETQPHRKVIIVDSEKELLLSASGFSGGLIVRDWFSPAVISLAELSFQLHQQLADAHDGRKRWGYSASTALSLVANFIDGEGKVTDKVVRGEDWLLHGASRAEVAKQFASGNLQRTAPTSHHERDQWLRDDDSPAWVATQKNGKFERISSNFGTAQVEPKELSIFLLEACQAKNVTVLLGARAQSIQRDDRGALTGLEIIAPPATHGGLGRRATIKCRDIVISAGCWTPRVYETLLGCKMQIGVKPLAGYSIVVRSPRYPRHIKDVDEAGKLVDMAHSIFCPPGPSWTYSPEAMARMTASGKTEIYVAGLNSDTIRLPALASQTKGLMDAEKLQDLKSTAVSLVGLETGQALNKDDLEVVREGLCFRPVSESGIPIISRVDGVTSDHQGGGIYVATGHGPWGITLSLGTGLVVAEMIAGKKGSSLNADVSEMKLPPQPSLLMSHL